MSVANTSIEAYQKLNKHRCELVKSNIVKYINSRKTYPTRSEISRAIKEPINVITPRVNELLDSKLTVKGRRKCTVTGSTAQVLGLI